MPLTKRQRLTRNKTRKFVGVEDAIDPGQPWRFNPAADEDTQWDIFNTLHPFSMGTNDFLEKETLFPGTKELPPAGAWIWLLRPPHSTVEATFGALYYAKPYVDADKTFGWRNMKYSVTCFTQNGEIRLWPYEYSKPNITEMIEFWAEGAFEFHPFDEALAGVELTERLFYITSRGIPMAEALPMVIGDILQPVGWFKIKGLE